MSLKGGWPLAHFLAFFARVIQRFLGLTVDHPGTMFCNTVFNIVGFCSGALAVFAFVWPFLLMLAFNVFLGGLSLHLNHLIASCAANYDWPFGTLPFGLFGSNLDTRDLETYPRTYSGHFSNMSIFDDSRAI